MKLTRTKIRKLIMQEIQSMGEDIIVPRSSASARSTPPMSPASTCEQCGGAMYEGECMECGESAEGVLEEGGCGCSSTSSDDLNINFIPDDMEHHDDNVLNMMLKHAGSDYEHNNYMAKPALYKVSKYAAKLLEMIPDGYELDDWQRTKIAQISDDISEVYHSLDYKMKKH